VSPDHHHTDHDGHDVDDVAAPDAGERDPELAAVLAVPPLDASTRAGLVRTALAEPGVAPAAAVADREGASDGEDATSSRSGRLAAVLGLAAALVIGAVVGTVIVTQPDDEGAQTAARAPATTARPAAKAAAPDAAELGSDAAEAPAAASAPVVDLGDLGAVEGPAGLRAAVNARLEAGTSGTPASSPCLKSGPGAAAGIYGLVGVNAAGTATLDGTTVVLLVGPTRAGQSVAVVLDPGRGCEFVRNVSL
jgi:hypothetical protein